MRVLVTQLACKQAKMHKSPCPETSYPSKTKLSTVNFPYHFQPQYSACRCSMSLGFKLTYYWSHRKPFQASFYAKLSWKLLCQLPLEAKVEVQGWSLICIKCSATRVVCRTILLRIQQYLWLIQRLGCSKDEDAAFKRLEKPHLLRAFNVECLSISSIW